MIESKKFNLNGLFTEGNPYGEIIFKVELDSKKAKYQAPTGKVVGGISYFEYKGYDVNYVSNFTDVDDKIIKTAIEQNVTEKEITDKFIVAYNDVRKGLHADLPDYAPRVTETMDRIIEFIDKMVKNGSAYQVGGDVYFRVNSD